MFLMGGEGGRDYGVDLIAGVLYMYNITVYVQNDFLFQFCLYA